MARSLIMKSLGGDPGMRETITSADDWQSTLDALQDSVWLMDGDQRIVRCNKAACDLLGRSADTMIGRRCCEVVHGTDCPIPECPMRRLRSSHQRESMDLEVGDKWYHVTVDPLPSSSDTGTWAVHVIRDITERKRVESTLKALTCTLGDRVDEQSLDLEHALASLETTQSVLRTSEQEKRAILDAPREHMMLLDCDMTIRWPNRAACESVNMTRETLTGRKCYTVCEDRTEPCPGCPVVLALEDGGDHDAEKVTSDGRFWFIRGYPIKNDNGKVVGAVEMTRDITDRKRTEQELQQSQQRFRVMFEMHDAVMLLIDPSSGCIIDANNAAAQFYGHSRDQLCRMNISEINCLTPDEIAVEMQRAKNMENNYFVFRHRLCDGKVRTVEVHSTPVEFQDRQLLFSVVHDITERERAEHALSESETKFRSVAEQSPNMIFINQGGRVVYANPACEARMGYTRAEFCDADFNFMTLIAPESVERVLEGLKQHMQGREQAPYELALTTRAGERIEAILSTRLIDYQGGKAILGTLTDITELKTAERLLLRQQQRLHRLAAQLTHAQDEEQRRIADGLHDDVGQLLAASKINLAIARGSKTPQKAEEAHQAAEALVKEASEKIGRLCFELGSSTLYRLGLHNAILELCESMRMRYGLKIDVYDDSGTEGIDDVTAATFFKAVRELLFNVLKHAGVDEATVTISRDDGSLNLVVEDHGRGFAYDSETESGEAGKGFGLFSLRERLRDLGGDIQIESTPSTGTRVHVRAPLTHGQAE